MSIYDEIITNVYTGVKIPTDVNIDDFVVTHFYDVLAKYQKTITILEAKQLDQQVQFEEIYTHTRRMKFIANSEETLPDDLRKAAEEFMRLQFMDDFL